MRPRTLGFPPVFALASLLLAMAGCSDVAATNPYDPASPGVQQAQGSVTGRIVLPEGFDLAQLLEPRVTLTGLAADSGEGAASEAPDADGAFVFESVIPGTYLLRILAPPLVGSTTTVVVGIGAAADVGDLVLAAPVEIPESLRGLLTGRAERLGAAADGHAGISIRMTGTPYSAATAADGTFALELPEGLYSVAFSAPGYGPDSVPDVRVAGLGATTEMPETMVLTAQDGRIQGTLVAPGRVDAGALLAASLSLSRDGDDEVLQVVNPDDQGRFGFPGVGVGRWQIVAALDRYTAATLSFDVAPGEAVDLGRIVLVGAPDGTLSGFARLAGAPEDGHAGIRVKVANDARSTETDADGAFTLTLPAGTYALRFDFPGYGSEAADALVIRAGETTPLPGEIALSARAGAIVGSVVLTGAVDPALVVQGVSLTLTRPDGELAADVAHPNADGAFALTELSPGAYSLALVADRFESTELAITIAPGQTVELGQVVLQPAPPGTLRGVAHLAGAPDGRHAGIRLTEPVDGAFAETGPDGAFVMQLPAGTYDLVFSHPGYASATHPQVRIDVGAETLIAQTVVLAAEPGRIRGVVRLPPGFDDALRMNSVVLSLRPTGDDGAPVDSDNPLVDGSFLFEGVVPGAWQIEATLSGFDSAVVGVEVEPGRAADAGTLQIQTIALEPGEQPTRVSGVARLGGIVRDDGHGGILVTVESTALTAVTGSDGRFQITGIPTDRAYTLNFQFRGYDPASAPVPQLNREQDYPLPEVATLAVIPGSVRGTIRLARFSDPARLQAVDVALRNDAGPQGAIRPDAQGAFLLIGVPPGELALSATLTGYTEAQRTLSLESGGSVDLGEVTLDHQSDGDAAVSLAGRVTLAGKVDHFGTRVQARFIDRDQPFRETITDVDGRFELPASPEESYRLAFEHAGYAAAPDAVGPVHWDAARSAFVTEADETVSAELAQNPIDGQISITPRVPDWLPHREQWVGLTLNGPGTQDVRQAPANGAPTDFPVVAEGTYFLTMARSGFATRTRVIVVSGVEPVVDLGEVATDVTDLAAAGMDLRGEPVDACDLRSGMILRGARLAGVELTGDFSSAALDCPDAAVTGPLDLSGVDLAGSDLRGAKFGSALGAPAAVLRGARLVGAELSSVDLRGTDATGADFGGARLRGTLLARAILESANFTSADATGALFVERRNAAPDDAFMQEFLGLWPHLAVPDEPMPALPCAVGVARPAVRLDGALFTRTILSGAFLPGTRLRGADFSGSLLIGADLRGACLAEASLTLLDMSGATLDDADLTGATLTSSVLGTVSMRGTTLDEASLAATVIDRADLRASLRPHCDVDLPALFRYAPGESCAQADESALCRCRTLARGTAFDGANLIGTVIEDADFSGASMQNITFGSSPGMADVQPADCALEEVFGCMQVYDMIVACDGQWCAGQGAGCTRFGALPEWRDADFWREEVCVGRDALSIGYAWRSEESDAAARFSGPGIYGPESGRIALDAFTQGGCGAVPQHFWAAPGGPPPAPPRVWQSTCTYDSLLADRDAPRELGSACVAAGNTVLPAECISAPTSISNSRFDEVKLIGTSLAGGKLRDVSFVGADFSGATLRQTFGESLDLRGARLTSANLQDMDMSFFDLRDADFRGALLDRTTMVEAPMGGADFRGASMRQSRIVTRDRAAGRPSLPPQMMLPAPQFAGADLSGVHIDLDPAHGPWRLSSNSPRERFQVPVLDGANLIGDFSGSVIVNPTNALDQTESLQFKGTCDDCVVYCKGCDLHFTGGTPQNIRAESCIVSFELEPCCYDPSVCNGQVCNLAGGGRCDGSAIAVSDSALIVDTSCVRAQISGNDADLVGALGGSQINATLSRFPQHRLDLTGATLIGANQSDLRGVDLRTACFPPLPPFPQDPDNGPYSRSNFAGARICTAHQAIVEAFNFEGTPAYEECDNPCP